MQDTARGILKLLEYLEEKLPGQNYVYRNGEGLPPIIQVEGASKEAVDMQIQPICDQISKDYDTLDLWIHWDEQGQAERDKSIVTPVAMIFVDETLGLVKMVLGEISKAWVLPADLAIDLLRKQIYNFEIAKR
jgi:hypothetical protein